MLLVSDDSTDYDWLQLDQDNRKLLISTVDNNDAINSPYHFTIDVQL